jgi:uncharacterized membrane protein YdjX (TVP38/TMEM64 family)
MANTTETSPDGAKSPWRWLQRGVAIAALAAVVYAVWSAWDRELFAAWKQEAGPLPYFIGMAILPAIGVPMTPLFVIAGAAFGRRIGLIGSVLALAAHFTLCYWIAHGRMRPLFQSLLGRFEYELPDFGKAGKRAGRFTLMMRLAPGLPSVVKTYALGMTGVPFGPYFALSMLISGLYAAAFVVFGESVLEHRPGRALLPLAVVAVIALGLWWLLRRTRGDGRRRAIGRPTEGLT